MDASVDEKSSFDESKLSDDVRICFVSARYRARYDGFYIFDVDFSKPELADEIGVEVDEIGGASGTAALNIFLNRASVQIGMIISTELKHHHYFHSHFEEPGQTPGVPIVSLGFLALLLVAFPLVLISFHGNPTLFESFATASAFSLLVLPISWYFRKYFIEFSHEKLSTAGWLSAAPVQLTKESYKDSLADLDILSSDYLINLPCEPMYGGQPTRIAIGQIRRNFLRNHESVTGLLVQDRKNDQEWYITLHRKAFLPALFFSIILVGIAFVANISNVKIPDKLLVYSLLVMSIVFAWNITLNSVLVFVFDLPKIKLLRKTIGFFRAADPINDVILLLLKNQSNCPKVSSPNISFGSVCEMLQIQLAGENQRLSIRQFWISVSSAALGVIFAVIGILFAASPREGAGNLTTKFECVVWNLDKDKVLQDCEIKR